MNATAARIQARMDATQIEINTVDGECRSNVRHLQRKLEGLNTPCDVDHNMILEIIAVGEALRNALCEKRGHIEKMEILRAVRNEALWASGPERP